MNSSQLISLGLILLVSVLVLVPSLKKVPGVSVILGLIAIIVISRLRPDTLLNMGFRSPENWLLFVGLSLLFGTLISLVSIMVIEPAIERVTNEPLDLTIVESVRGNPKALLQWIVIVWVLVAFTEEFIYRGFLMGEMVRLSGGNVVGLMLSLVLTSFLFGIAHLYQGRSGALSTGIIGLFLGSIYIWSDYNLWLPILTHGFIDTVSLGLMYIRGDYYLRGFLWRSAK